MRTLWVYGEHRGPPRTEVGGPQGQRPTRTPDLDPGHGRSKAQDLGGLQGMPRCDPRRATDADTSLRRNDQVRILTNRRAGCGDKSQVRFGGRRIEKDQPPVSRKGLRTPAPAWHLASRLPYCKLASTEN